MKMWHQILSIVIIRILMEYNEENGLQSKGLGKHQQGIIEPIEPIIRIYDRWKK